jgi:hypothetical protein
MSLFLQAQDEDNYNDMYFYHFMDYGARSTKLLKYYVHYLSSGHSPITPYNYNVRYLSSG